MRFSYYIQKNVAIVQLADLNSHTPIIYKKKWSELIQHPEINSMILNMEQIPEISSSDLMVLAQLCNQCDHAEKALYFYHLNPAFNWLISLLDMDKSVPTLSSLDHAC
ncbi:MAG: STAS domain-containing protein [SAR324 cluster bacterium]|nr:STAS domain-containing protein [SAR324 cluster bacterium]